MTKYQAAEASANPEVPEDLESDASDITEVPKYNEVPVSGAKD